MPESPEEQEKRHLKELEGRNVAQYSVLLGAWVQTRMERDKTLITLSSGGIALLITILTTVGFNTWGELILFVGSFIGLGVCIWSSLRIYQLNSQHIEREFRSQDSADLPLEKYDKISFRSFIIGIVCFCTIGIVAGVNNFTDLEAIKMEKETTSQPKGEKFKKSLQGLQNLRPESVSKPNQSGSSQQQGSSSQTSGSSNSGSNKKD